MDIVQTMRWIVFSSMYTSAVIPTYLAIRFHTPEWLFLYGPVLAFWTMLIYAQFEGNQVTRKEEPPDDKPVIRPQ